jgi:hypothetical protein
MNEEVNYCDQCGAKASLDAKFCSSCGSVLDGKSQPNFDAHIRVSTHNEITENGLEHVGRVLSFVLRQLKICWLFLNRNRKRIILIIGIWVILFVVAVSWGEIRDWYLGQEKKRAHEELKLDRDKTLKDLKLRIEAAQSNVIDFGWVVAGTNDPAREIKIVRSVSIRSTDGLCYISINKNINGYESTTIGCDFGLYKYADISLKYNFKSNAKTISTRPHLRVNDPMVSDVNIDKWVLRSQEYLDGYGLSDANYHWFLRDVARAKVLAVKVTPIIDHEFYRINSYPNYLSLDPIWIRFSLKGAKEAIAKLGQELRE